MLFMGNFRKIALISFQKLDETNLTSFGQFFIILLKTNLGYFSPNCFKSMQYSIPKMKILCGLGYLKTTLDLE